MFRRSITIRSADDARRERRRLKADIDSAGLPPLQARFLHEQIDIAFGQFEDQLAPHLERQITADRLFEGDDYSVAIKVRQGAPGLVERVKSMLGL